MNKICELIISTHSPIVLSGVEGNVIRLDNDGSVENGLSTYGRRADYIMYENQGVCTRDEEIQSEIDKFYRLLEIKEDLKETKEILENLFISKFGENDPDTRRAIRNYDFAFLEFEEEEE